MKAPAATSIVESPVTARNDLSLRAMAETEIRITPEGKRLAPGISDTQAHFFVQGSALVSGGKVTLRSEVTATQVLCASSGVTDGRAKLNAGLAAGLRRVRATIVVNGARPDIAFDESLLNDQTNLLPSGRGGGQGCRAGCGCDQTKKN